jgi:hypothetical protein
MTSNSTSWWTGSITSVRLIRRFSTACARSGRPRELLTAAVPQINWPPGCRNTMLEDSGAPSIGTDSTSPVPRYKAAFVVDAPKSIAAIISRHPGSDGGTAGWEVLFSIRQEELF